MEYEKVSDSEFTATETKQDVKKYNIVDLKNDKAIYLAHVAEYQAKADAVDALIVEAEKLGVVEPVVEPTEEPII